MGGQAKVEEEGATVAQPLVLKKELCSALHTLNRFPGSSDNPSLSLLSHGPVKLQIFLHCISYYTCLPAPQVEWCSCKAAHRNSETSTSTHRTPLASGHRSIFDIHLTSAYKHLPDNRCQGLGGHWHLVGGLRTSNSPKGLTRFPPPEMLQEHTDWNSKMEFVSFPV